MTRQLSNLKTVKLASDKDNAEGLCVISALLVQENWPPNWKR